MKEDAEDAEKKYFLSLRAVRTGQEFTLTSSSGLGNLGESTRNNGPDNNQIIEFLARGERLCKSATSK